MQTQPIDTKFSALQLRVAHLWPVWPALLKLASQPTPVAIPPTTPLYDSRPRGAPPKSTHDPK